MQRRALQRGCRSWAGALGCCHFGASSAAPTFSVCCCSVPVFKHKNVCPQLLPGMKWTSDFWVFPGMTQLRSCSLIQAHVLPPFYSLLKMGVSLGSFSLGSHWHALTFINLKTNCVFLGFVVIKQSGVLNTKLTYYRSTEVTRASTE